MDIKKWISEIEVQTKRAESLISNMTEEQLNISPAPGKWSSGQLVAHIATTNETYFDVFTQIGDGSYSGVSNVWIRFIPKMLGKMIINSITPETKRKVKTVPVFVPSETVFTKQLIEEFKSSQDQLCSLVQNFEGLALSDIWIKSPASGMIIYTLEDCLSMMLNHEKRHLGQIEEIVNNFDV